MKKILGNLRRAVNDYKMIADGDKIAVGISGGKDSLVLLDALARYQKFAPEKFELVGIHIDMGFKNGDTQGLEAVKAFFAERDIPLILEKTDIAEIVFDVRKEDNPCSLCSKMRRGALCSVANREGCNKVALGHHADDVLDTMLLSFFYEGRLSTFAPKSYMSRSDITVIRPLIYVSEGESAGAARRFEMPVIKSPCPADKFTKREDMKKIVEHICKEIPFAKDRMISAIQNPERYNLWDKKETN